MAAETTISLEKNRLQIDAATNRRIVERNNILFFDVYSLLLQPPLRRKYHAKQRIHQRDGKYRERMGNGGHGSARRGLATVGCREDNGVQAQRHRIGEQAHQHNLPIGTQHPQQRDIRCGDDKQAQQRCHIHLGVFKDRADGIITHHKKEEPTMAKLTFQTELCKGCGLCVNACPKGILTIAADRINQKGYSSAVMTDESKCIGCAFCATMCPDCIITVER